MGKLLQPLKLPQRQLKLLQQRLKLQQPKLQLPNSHSKAQILFFNAYLIQQHAKLTVERRTAIFTTLQTVETFVIALEILISPQEFNDVPQELIGIHPLTIVTTWF